MNKEQQQIIDEVYENYLTDLKSRKHHEWILSQEQFINKIKTDNEFSETWGLKIEERELSYEERLGMTPADIGFSWTQWTSGNLDDFNIPTKLITVTYNDKTIESYE
jgi:hypothetical protein